ncbi:hypothetical protein M885DRAFT_500200 [Pelagophyceae sp. CCMP2097]|nr:hypothetical protein M885DRAFT_500200 [Pelagophyceae sp. CCMP2097]
MRDVSATLSGDFEGELEKADRRRCGCVSARVFRTILQKSSQGRLKELLVQQLSSRFAHPRDAEAVWYVAFLDKLSEAVPTAKKAQSIQQPPRVHPLQSKSEDVLWRGGVSPKKRRDASGLVAAQGAWVAADRGTQPAAGRPARSGSAASPRFCLDAPDMAPSERLFPSKAVPPAVPPSPRPTWSCFVCYHSENPFAAKKCGICYAANPTLEDSVVFVECPKCTFPNAHFSTSQKCQICDAGLCTPNAARLLKQSKPAPHPGKDGWRDGFGSDDDDQACSNWRLR